VDGLRVRVSLYAAALVTGGAFSILFTGEISEGVESFSSPGKALLVMLGAALVALLVGSAGRYRFVLVFPATALYALLAVYGRPPLFSLSAWKELTARIAADVYEAASIMYVEPVPYDLTPGLLVSLIPVVMVVVAFSVSATLYEESPVISVTVLGLTIGVLSTISFEDGAGPFFFLFLICAVALLLAAGPAERAGRIGWPGVVAGLAVVALVLALPRAPLAEKTLSTGLIDWTHIGTGGTSRLDVQADVGDYLTAGRDAELMRVHSPEPLLWRAGTLDYFDGVRWSDTTQPGDDDGEEIAPGIETHSVVQSVEILDAEADRVFGGYRIVVVSLDSAQQNSDSSWSLSTPLTEGDYYRVLSEIPQPSEEQLQSAGTSYPSGVRERFLQLPENRPEVLAETAQKIQDDYSPDNPYETARAIERYLLYDGGFTYNLDADFRRADRAIEEFLGDGKEGFCTQFATSMALLARELDVPSRVVYGATPGRETGTDEYVVTGTNMHTWVEVYFPGVGWYPFDGGQRSAPGEPRRGAGSLPRATRPAPGRSAGRPADPSRAPADPRGRRILLCNAREAPRVARLRGCRGPAARRRAARQAPAPRPRTSRGPLPGPHGTPARRAAAWQGDSGRLPGPHPDRAHNPPRRRGGRRGGAVRRVRPGVLGSPLLRTPQPGHLPRPPRGGEGHGPSPALAATARLPQPRLPPLQGQAQPRRPQNAARQGASGEEGAESALTYTGCGVIIFVRN
jgi:transglutaminase-like putative cysteine protease